MITSLADLLETARRRPTHRLVLAGAAHASSLQGVVDARRAGLIETAVLVDEAGTMAQSLRDLGESVEDFELVEVSSEVEIAAASVELVNAGRADVLLKGRVSSGALLKAVLAHDTGLRTDRILSDVMVTEDPLAGTARLLGVTDGGVNVAPNFEAKKQIIENATRVFHRLGFDRPRVALLCAVEVVTDSMPYTMEARRLVELHREGQMAGYYLDGPLALDNALSMEAARAKGLDSPVAGQADILVVPNIEAGNILGKAFRYLANKPVAHVIEGARAPILIPSRTESARDKLYSIALGTLCV